MLSTFWWDKFDSYSRATQFGSRCSVMKIFGARFPPLLNIGAGWNFTGRRFRVSGTSTLVSFLTKFLTLTDLGRGLDWWGTTHWRTGSAIWYEWIQNRPNLKAQILKLKSLHQGSNPSIKPQILLSLGYWPLPVAAPLIITQSHKLTRGQRVPLTI